MENERIAALERWLIREIVFDELEPFLLGNETINDKNQSLIQVIFNKLCEFPPFSGDKHIENALKEVFALLPKVEKMLKARKGKSLRSYLGPLISGPILSRARTTRNTQSISINKSAYFAAMLLHQLNEEPNGLQNFLEELKSCHSVNELRPICREYAKAIREDFLDLLKRTWSFQKQKEKLRIIYQRIPKTVFLLLLKSHSVTSVSSSSFRILFMNPFGGWSIFQRMLADGLDYDRIENDIKQIEKQQDSYDCERIHNYFDSKIFSSIENETEEDFQLYCEEFSLNFQSSLHFLRLLEKRKSTLDFISVFSEKETINSIYQLITLTQTRLTNGIFEKGSGLVKLIEELFRFLDDILPEENLPIEKCRNSIDKLLMRGLSILHNLLLSDDDGVFHASLAWYFRLFQTVSSLQLPTDELIIVERQQPEEYENIMDEAKQAYERELSNADPMKTFIPRPNLKTSRDILLPPLRKVVLDKFQEINSTALNKTESLELNQEHEENDSNGIKFLEISFRDALSTKFLERRKYKICGETSSTLLWKRSVIPYPVTFHSIVEIAFSKSDEFIEKQEANWLLIPKNLNKSSYVLSKLYLWFRRAKDEEEEKLYQIRGLEFVQKEVDIKSLLETGFRNVGSLDTGIFSQIQVWMLGGLNKEIL